MRGRRRDAHRVLVSPHPGGGLLLDGKLVEAEVTTAACFSHLRAGHGQSKWASGESLFEDGVRGTGALQSNISARSELRKRRNCPAQPHTGQG